MKALASILALALAADAFPQSIPQAPPLENRVSALEKDVASLKQQMAGLVKRSSSLQEDVRSPAVRCLTSKSPGACVVEGDVVRFEAGGTVLTYRFSADTCFVDGVSQVGVNPQALKAVFGQPGVTLRYCVDSNGNVSKLEMFGYKPTFGGVQFPVPQAPSACVTDPVTGVTTCGPSTGVYGAPTAFVGGSEGGNCYVDANGNTVCGGNQSRGGFRFFRGGKRGR